METLLQIPFEECHSRMDDPVFQVAVSSLLSPAFQESALTRVYANKAPKLDSLCYLVMYIELKQRFGWETYRQVRVQEVLYASSCVCDQMLQLLFEYSRLPFDGSLLSNQEKIDEVFQAYTNHLSLVSISCF